MPRDPIPRRDLHVLLEHAFDLLDAHNPASGESTSPGKDAAMQDALEHLDTLISAFQPARDHVFHRALAAER